MRKAPDSTMLIMHREAGRKEEAADDLAVVACPRVAVFCFAAVALEEGCVVGLCTEESATVRVELFDFVQGWPSEA